MPTFWWDEVTMGEFTLDPNKLQSQAFMHMVIDRSHSEWVKEIVLPELSGEDIIRKRKYMFDEALLINSLNVSDLKNKIHGPDAMPVIDGTGINFIDKVKRSIDTDWSKIARDEDLKAVTSGDYNVGTAGDYANFTAFDADIGTQTGTLRGIAISDMTETAFVFLSHNADSNDFRITTDTDHAGVTGAGWNVNFNVANSGFIIAETNPANIEIDTITLTRLINAGNSTQGLVQSTTDSNKIDMHHLIIDGGGFTSAGIRTINKTTTGDQIWSNLIFDCTNGFWVSDSTNTNVLTVENTTIRGCTSGINIQAGDAGVYTNNVAFTNTTDFNIGTSVSETGNNNASVDATADDFATQANNLISLTEADEVESTTDTDSNFMHPKSTSNIKDGGKAPTIAANTTDITGTSYGGTNPNGCYLEPVAGGFGGLLSTKRNRLVLGD